MKKKKNWSEYRPVRVSHEEWLTEQIEVMSLYVIPRDEDGKIISLEKMERRNDENES
jgi:hypothetical protein